MKYSPFPALLALSLCASAQAVTVVPVSYDMPNGSSGNYTYWDDLYSGSGCKTCNGAALTGGKGDLTDGVIASQVWQVAEAPAGPGPYVGWANINPTITFHFGQVVTLSSATFSFDNSGAGGVVAPASVVIGGQTFPVNAPTNSGVYSFTASGLTFSGSDLTVVINRTSAFTFASEVSFQSPVPEPGTSALMLAGMVAVTGIALRRRRPT